MKNCRHRELVLVKQEGRKLRCRRCHLTIDEKDLKGHCPECWEVHGVRHRDFDEIEPKEGGSVRYRCEGCGVFIDVD